MGSWKQGKEIGNWKKKLRITSGEKVGKDEGGGWVARTSSWAECMRTTNPGCKDPIGRSATALGLGAASCGFAAESELHRFAPGARKPPRQACPWSEVAEAMIGAWHHGQLSFNARLNKPPGILHVFTYEQVNGAHANKRRGKSAKIFHPGRNGVLRHPGRTRRAAQQRGPSEAVLGCCPGVVADKAWQSPG